MTTKTLEQIVGEKFRSGNAIPVERITLTRAELESIQPAERPNGAPDEARECCPACEGYDQPFADKPCATCGGSGEINPAAPTQSTQQPDDWGINKSTFKVTQQPDAGEPVFCERCGEGPGMHTPSHWCDNQSFRQDVPVPAPQVAQTAEGGREYYDSEKRCREYYEQRPHIADELCYPLWAAVWHAAHYDKFKFDSSAPPHSPIADREGLPPMPIMPVLQCIGGGKIEYLWAYPSDEMTKVIRDYARAAIAAQPKADSGVMREALERIADPRNTHFAGDAQIVARAALAAQPKDSGVGE